MTTQQKIEKKGFKVKFAFSGRMIYAIRNDISVASAPNITQLYAKIKNK